MAACCVAQVSQPCSHFPAKFHFPIGNDTMQCSGSESRVQCVCVCVCVCVTVLDVHMWSVCLDGLDRVWLRWAKYSV